MSNEKFKSLVHFIVHECQDNPSRLGAVRLNKALWFTDMLAYQANGVSVTREKYIKRKNGPVPATILATLEELEKEEKIMIRQPEHHYDSRKFICLVAPDESLLSDDERILAKHVLDFVCEHSANKISEITHEEIWHAAQEGEEIPMYATLATGQGVITDEVKNWAESIVQKHQASIT